jgi:DNA/RNA-binding protein KIN17
MQEALVRKEKMDKDDQEKLMAFIEKQIEKGKECAKNNSPVFTEFVRPSEEGKTVVNLKLETKRNVDVKNKLLVSSNPLKNDYKGGESSSSGNKNKVSKEYKRDRGEKRKASALYEIFKYEENKKERINRKGYWLVEGIVVKVIAKTLGDEYYKKKGVVTEVPNKYVATVSMLHSGHKLKLDQAHLETVIPAIGRPVLVVNGAYRGCSAILKELDEKKFCVTIEISSSPLKGRIVDKVEYGDICKLHNADV